MASNDVYNVYKRNGTSHNKINSNQTKLHSNTKVNDESEMDNNMINIHQTQQESNVLEGVIFLSDDDFSNDNAKSKHYIRKHLEPNAKMKTKSTTQEIIQSNDNNTNSQNPKCVIINLETRNDDCKDNKYVSNVVDVVVQNLLDVAIIKNMSTSVESINFLNDKGECEPKCDLECNHSNVVNNILGMENNVNIYLEKKSELEREMEIYEAFERDEEAQLVIRDPHELLKEESTIETKIQNKKKRALEGHFYEHKNKRYKCEQNLVTKTKNEEDVCFICFDGGDLVLCDHR